MYTIYKNIYIVIFLRQQNGCKYIHNNTREAPKIQCRLGIIIFHHQIKRQVPKFHHDNHY